MSTPSSPAERVKAECLCDGELTPRWRGPEVMGDDSKALGFVCHACGREYLPPLVRDRKLLAR